MANGQMDHPHHHVHALSHNKELTTTTSNNAMLEEESQKTSQSEERDIPIKLSLAGATLSLSSTGQWELENSALQEYIERTIELKTQLESLEKENQQLKEKCTRLTEESNMEKFKCQLLVEMLAVSSLDEEKSKLEMDRAKARMTSLQNDFLVLLDNARKEGMDVAKFVSALSSLAPPHAP